MAKTTDDFVIDHQAAGDFLNSLGVLGDSEAVGWLVVELQLRAKRIAEGDEEPPDDLLS